MASKIAACNGVVILTAINPEKSPLAELQKPTSFRQSPSTIHQTPNLLPTVCWQLAPVRHLRKSPPVTNMRMFRKEIIFFARVPSLSYRTVK